MRLWILSVAVLLFLFCTVRLHAQNAQVSPVSNLQGSNASVINNNLQILQSGVNGVLYVLGQYFTNGYLNTISGGTGTNSSTWVSGDSVIMTNTGTWGVSTPFGVPSNGQLFTSSGTWTNPGSKTKAWVIAIGAGGGGNYLCPALGGNGAYAEGPVTVSGNMAVTVGTGGSNGNGGGGGLAGGTGGTSSFGTISAGGGTGGGASPGCANGSNGSASGAQITQSLYIINTMGSNGQLAGQGSSNTGQSGVVLIYS